MGLNNSIYKPSAAYGHFGRVPDEEVKGSFSWEKTDLVSKSLNPKSLIENIWKKKGRRLSYTKQKLVEDFLPNISLDNDKN